MYSVQVNWCLKAAVVMEKPVFVYWDCFEANDKLDFKNIFKLAVANRPVKHIVLCGSIASELLWIYNQLPAKLDTCPSIALWVNDDG